jgi:hypothetical protein
MHRPLSARARPRNKDPVRSADHELFPTQRLLTEGSLVRVQPEAALTQSRNNLADAYRLAPIRCCFLRSDLLVRTCVARTRQCRLSPAGKG